MWRRLVATALAAAVVSIGLVTLQAGPAQAATYYNSRCGNTSGRVLLTFDDWAYGDPYRATRIGAYLQSRNIRAMFFLINQYASKYPDIVSTLRRQGHWVLNHTWSHPDLTQLSDSGVSWQIRNGIKSNRLRPPYGAYNSRVSAIASNLGYRICTWTIDTRDWQKPDGVHYRSTASIRGSAATASHSDHPGSIDAPALTSSFATSW